MSCESIRPELVGFHFGVVTESARAEVEAHLVGCEGCLREYLTLKRDVETGEAGERPSTATRSRLRRDVARELGVREPKPGWAWWERPFAFGVAGAAVLFAMVATHLVATGGASPPHSVELSQSRAAP